MMNDPRDTAWEKRRIAQDRLAALTAQRKALCGLSCCGQEGRLEELRVLIQRADEQVAEYSDQITDLLTHAY